MITDRIILEKIEQQPKQAAGFKQLVRELRVRGDNRRELSERLEKMVSRGELVEIDGGRYALPKEARRRNIVTGRLSMHRDGYGFVTPDDAATRKEISGDIYISPGATMNAMHGDRVMVEVGQVRADGRAEGRILRVATRAHETVVGTFHYGERQNYVVPIDEKITQEIIIPSGLEWPTEHREDAGDTEGTKHKKPRGLEEHRVIGTEARRREIPKTPAQAKPGLGRGTRWEDLDGVVVDVEITDWPTPTQNPRGRVVEILGYEDDFGVDVEIVIRKYHLPHRFGGEVLQEAQSFPDVISGRELRARRDFRALPIVTIDGETARDFDDAVTVSRLANGNWELQVHIADVAHYVTDGSALDEEARLRGTSVYFPDRSVPMLPIELSTDICSLRPKIDRLVLSCVMEIDNRGEVLGYEVCEGVIRSAERMTYTDVNAILEGDANVRGRYAPLVETFERMGELAQILNRKRVRRGSIDFDLPEPVIEFDEFGLMRAITRSERNQAHRLIEEFMLSANESVASYLEQKKIASLYRIHEKPDARKIYDFESVAAQFGYSLGVGAISIKRMQTRGDRRERYGSGRRAPTIEIPEDVNVTPRMYQKLTQKLAGKPEERILSYLMLRSLKQARYSEENEGHFALAAPTYTHFTSPIRRYPDLIVHRILKQVLRESAEAREGEVMVGQGVPVTRPYGDDGTSQDKQHGSPWTHGKRKPEKDRGDRDQLSGPIDLDELHDIAEQSSDTERRADDAERELMDWKKIKFMQDRVGEEFEALIISVTKFGFFVELVDLFIEGLVPLATLQGDRFTFRENTRQIIGERTKKMFSLGDRVQVWLDRIDRSQRKLQFALVQEEPKPSRSPFKKKRKRAER